jgi:hypothetical protein
MIYNDPHADDLRNFFESREAAKRSQEDARAEQREIDERIIAAAPTVHEEFRAMVTDRVQRLASAVSRQRIECVAVGNTTTIRLDAVEANAVFHAGRPSDAFGPLLPFIEFRLTRTSLTIGADVMPPGVGTYRTPQPRSEQIRLVAAPEGIVWLAAGATKSSADLAEYVVASLVEYFKENCPVY